MVSTHHSCNTGIETQKMFVFIIQALLFLLSLSSMRSIHAIEDSRCMKQPVVSSDKNMTNRCPDPPTGKLLINSLYASMVISFMLGRDYAQVKENMASCVLTTRYTLTPSSCSSLKFTSHDVTTPLITSGSKAGTDYVVEWYTFFRHKDTNRTSARSLVQTTRMQTLQPKDVTIKGSITLSRKEKSSPAEITMSWGNLKPTTENLVVKQYRLEWFPGACKDGTNERGWANGTAWANTTSTTASFLEQDLCPYALFNASVIFSDGISHKHYYSNPTNFTTAAKAPENRIDSLQCNDTQCQLALERNCYKQNAPSIYLNVSISPVDPALKQYVNHTKLFTTLYEGAGFSLPSGLLPFTLYNVSVALAGDAEGTVVNEKQRKWTNFTTPPAAPNPFAAVELLTAHRFFTVRWKNPPRAPPTGNLEKVTTISPLTHNRQQLWTPEKKKISSGWNEWTEFNVTWPANVCIQISAKNFDVEMETLSNEACKKLEKGKPSPPTIQDDSWTTSTTNITFKISPPQNGIQVDSYNVYAEHRNSSDGKPYNKTVKLSSKEKTKPLPYSLDQLKENSPYVIKTRGCTSGGLCSDWSIEYTKWTNPNPQLNDAFTVLQFTNTYITFTVEKINYSGKCGRYILGEAEFYGANEAELRQLTMDTKQSITMRENLLLVPIAPNRTQDPFSVYYNGTGKKYRFATVLVIHRGRGAEEFHLSISSYSPYFDPDQDQTATKWALIGGLCLTLVIGGVILFVLSHRLVKSRLQAKAKLEASQPDSASRLLDRAATSFKQSHDVTISNVRNLLKQRPTSINAENGSHYVNINEGTAYSNLNENEPTLPEVPLSLLPSPEINHSDEEVKAEDKIRSLKNSLNEYRLSEHLKSHFEEIPSRMPHLHTSFGCRPENIKKNRYKNILPYDETLVLLPPQTPGAQFDYINASYIHNPFHGNPNRRWVIATQGPKNSNVDTITDFYRMVWQDKPSHIVMLACLVENGTKKVSQYWPDNVDEAIWFGNIAVQLVNFQEELDYVIRHLLVTFDDETIEVIQYQYTAWPDHGVPTTPHTLSLLTMRIEKESLPDRPIVVHCSAGVGRTGTLILALFALNQIASKGYVNCVEGLYYLRCGRPKLVGNASQFAFTHELLIAILTRKERRFAPVDFVHKFSSLEYFFHEFESIQMFKWQVLENETYEAGSAHQVAHLNRDGDLLPGDSNVVFVSPLEGGIEDALAAQYINAICLRTCCNFTAPVMVCEHPQYVSLERTWQLIYQYQVSLWVVGNYFNGEEQDWPSVLPPLNQPFLFRFFQVDLIEEGTDGCCHYASIRIHRDNEGEHTCKVIQILSWGAGEPLPPSLNPPLIALEQIMASISTGAPVLITCADGVTVCGILVTLLIALSELEAEGEVDVFKASLKAVYNRPQFICSVAQYSFIYQALCHYLEEKGKQQQVEYF